MFISSFDAPSTDLWAFLNSELDEFERATTGHFDIKETSMCCEVFDSHKASVYTQYTYSDATFNTYVYEHLKTYAKYGDRIYTFDFAADSQESFRKYVDIANNIIHLSLSRLL